MGHKQSCRSTAASLAEYCERWSAIRHVFRDWAFEGSYHVWTLICVDFTMCGVIVTGQLRVVGSCISIAEDHANDELIVQEVLHLVGAV